MKYRIKQLDKTKFIVQFKLKYWPFWFDDYNLMFPREFEAEGQAEEYIKREIKLTEDKKFKPKITKTFE